MTVDDLIREVQQLQREVAALANATRQSNAAAPVPVPTPTPTPTLPPRPGSPTAGAANHLSNILNGGSGIPTNHISPEEQAKREARQRALLACNEATRAMAMASVQRIVTPRPNLQDFINDPNYHWIGYDIIAAAQAHPSPGTHVPRPI